MSPHLEGRWNPNFENPEKGKPENQKWGDFQNKRGEANHSNRIQREKVTKLRIIKPILCTLAGWWFKITLNLKLNVTN